MTKSALLLRAWRRRRGHILPIGTSRLSIRVRLGQRRIAKAVKP